MGALHPDVLGNLGEAGPDHILQGSFLPGDHRPRQLAQRARGDLLLHDQPQQRRPRPRQQQA